VKEGEKKVNSGMGGDLSLTGRKLRVWMCFGGRGGGGDQRKEGSVGGSRDLGRTPISRKEKRSRR